MRIVLVLLLLLSWVRAIAQPLGPAGATVNTLNDLLSRIPQTSYPAVSVLGYQAAGDWGPARVARYDALSELATNELSVFGTITGVGRWIFDPGSMWYDTTNKVLQYTDENGVLFTIASFTNSTYARLDRTNYFQSTNWFSELSVSNGITLGGVRRTTWPAGGTNSSAIYVDGSQVSDPNLDDGGDINFTATGTNITGAVKADSVTLATDTTGNFVATVTGTANEVGVAGSGSENAAVTLSLPATIDLGSKTSFEVPNSATPSVDALGEVAADSDAWGASRGSLVTYDGTAVTRIVGVLESDSPSNGQVLKWNTGGIITWEDDLTGTFGSSVYFGGSFAGHANFTNNADVSFIVTGTNITGVINSDSVALGTDTTGNYVSSVAGTSGRITASGSGESAAVTIDLATSGVSSGSYTNPTITVDTYGRITAATNGTASTGGGLTFVSGTAVTNINLNNTTPAAPATGANVLWQLSSTNASAYLVTSNFPTLNGTNTFTSTNTFGTVVATTLEVTSPIPLSAITNAVATDSEVAAAYQPLDTDLTALAGLAAGSTGLVQRTAAGAMATISLPGGTNTYLRADGTFATPPTTAGGTNVFSYDIDITAATTNATATPVFTNVVTAGYADYAIVDILAAGVTNSASFRVFAWARNDSGTLTFRTNALDSWQPLDSDLTVLAGNDGSALTSTGATNDNQLVTLSQLRSFTASGQPFYVYGRSNAASLSIAASSTNWAYTSPSTNTVSFTNTFTSVTNNQYLMAWVSSQTFSNIHSGVLTVDVYALKGASGTASINPEVYLYDTVANAEVFEFTPAPAARALNTAKTMYQFSVPISDYITNRALRVVVKIKATATSSPDISIVSEGSDISHFMFQVPLTDYLSKTEAAATYFPLSSVPIAITNGGTGATTAAGARTNLGLVIGSDVQGYDADLASVAGVATNGFFARTGAGTAASRIIRGGANVTVTDGDGVAADPVISVNLSTNAAVYGLFAVNNKTNSTAQVFTSGSTWQIVTNTTLSNELIDTDNRFNTTTMLYSPGVNGYYWFYASLAFSAPTNTARISARISKNGAPVTTSDTLMVGRDVSDGTNISEFSGGGLMYCTTNDTVGLYVLSPASSNVTNFVGNEVLNQFTGWLVR